MAGAASALSRANAAISQSGRALSRILSPADFGAGGGAGVNTALNYTTFTSLFQTRNGGRIFLDRDTYDIGAHTLVITQPNLHIQGRRGGTTITTSALTLMDMGVVGSGGASVLIGSIASNVLTVTGVTGAIPIGSAISCLVAAANGRTITSQLTGLTGGAGTYVVSAGADVAVTAMSFVGNGNITIENINFVSTGTNSAADFGNALVRFSHIFGSNYTFRNCTFSIPSAMVAAISVICGIYLTYSGKITGLNFENCRIIGAGGMGLLLDNTDQYSTTSRIFDFRWVGGAITNTGLLDPLNGQGISCSGYMEDFVIDTRFDNNLYAAIEFSGTCHARVSGRCTNLRQPASGAMGAAISWTGNFYSGVYYMNPAVRRMTGNVLENFIADDGSSTEIRLWGQDGLVTKGNRFKCTAGTSGIGYVSYAGSINCKSVGDFYNCDGGMVLRIQNVAKAGGPLAGHGAAYNNEWHGLTMDHSRQAAPIALVVCAGEGTNGNIINGITYSSGNAGTALITNTYDTTFTATTTAGNVTFTGSIAPGTASFTGVIAANQLTVSALTGYVQCGTILTGTGVEANRKILGQITGTPGGAGTYQVSTGADVASTTMTIPCGILTVTATTGTLLAGPCFTGATAGTQILSQLTGIAGSTGTYQVSISQTVASTAMNMLYGTLTVAGVNNTAYLTSGQALYASSNSNPIGLFVCGSGTISGANTTFPITCANSGAVTTLASQTWQAGRAMSNFITGRLRNTGGYVPESTGGFQVARAGQVPSTMTYNMLGDNAALVYNVDLMPNYLATGSLNITSGVTLTATRNLTFPPGFPPTRITNSTTGGQSITISTPAGFVFANIPNAATLTVMGTAGGAVVVL